MNWRLAMRSWALALVALMASGHAAAEGMTPVAEHALPALPAGSDVRALATVGDTPFAIGEGSLLQLAPGASQWRRVEPAVAGQALSRVSAAFSDGRRTWVVSDRADGAESIAALELGAAGYRLRTLPALPAGLHGIRGAATDSAVFVAGMASDGARLLQLVEDAKASRWESLPAWPGGAPPSTLAARGSVVVLTAGGAVHRWSSARAAWSPGAALPGRLLANAAIPLGQANVLYPLQGADGSVRIFSYQTITDAWTPLATLPATSAPAIAFGPAKNGWVAAHAGGAGGVSIDAGEVKPGRHLLKPFDWIVVIVYLAAMVGIGYYFYRRDRRNASTSTFFVGGRSIPFWAAGISLYAANTSSISFIAIPAKAFESNWQYLTNNLIAVVGLMFVAVWIVPLLRRLDLMSVFSYLETRFHPAIRMLASALCILTQIGSRMSVILFLPALAISTITGISVTWSVILMGGFTILYTAMGGMKAVIWTDVVQVIIKMGGAIFAIGYMIWHLRGGFGEFWSTAMADHKMKLFDFSFDLTKATVWGFIFLVVFDVVLTFPKDQVLMQRTLSTGSDKEAGRSIWAFAAIMIPGGFVFYMIGTALFVYYRAHPERLNPTLPIDATFPLFIAAELPTGVTGLIIAGIFAAVMATLSGIMNSVATLASVDFYEKLARNRTQRKSVLFAEIMTVVTGLVGIGAALFLSRFDIHSLFDVSIELAGLLGGGFAGAYTLGMFTRRANSQGVAIGIAGSICLTLVAWSFKLVHPYFYLAISILLCIVIGYLASLLFPPPKQSLKGLTIYRDAA